MPGVKIFKISKTVYLDYNASLKSKGNGIIEEHVGMFSFHMFSQIFTWQLGMFSNVFIMAA